MLTTIKIVCALSFLAVLASTVPVDDFPVLGGVSQISGNKLEQAEKSLRDSLTKLAAGDGPHYKLVKIHSVTEQVVSGWSNVYKVDLEDEQQHVKHCQVSIWSQPWLANGKEIEVTFDCEGDAKLVKKHSV